MLKNFYFIFIWYILVSSTLIPTTSTSQSTKTTSSLSNLYFNFDQNYYDFEIDQTLNINLIKSEYIQNLKLTVTDVTSICKKLK